MHPQQEVMSQEAFGFKELVFPGSQPLVVGKSKSHPSAYKLEEIDPHNLAGFCRNLRYHEKSLCKEIWLLFLEDIYRLFTPSSLLPSSLFKLGACAMNPL